jgi:hypothetical protein
MRRNTRKHTASISFRAQNDAEGIALKNAVLAVAKDPVDAGLPLRVVEELQKNGVEKADFNLAIVRPKKAVKVELTDSQVLVLGFLAGRPSRWFRPGDIRPAGYEGGASTVGRVLSSLKTKGLVVCRKCDRGNGSSGLEWTVAPNRGGRP